MKTNKKNTEKNKITQPDKDLSGTENIKTTKQPDDIPEKPNKKKISAAMRENAKNSKFVYTDEDMSGINVTENGRLDIHNEHTKETNESEIADEKNNEVLNEEEMSVLNIIAENLDVENEEECEDEISDVTYEESDKVKKILASLVEKGLIETEEEDGVIYVTALTDKGREMLEKEEESEETEVEEIDFENMPFEGANWYNEIGRRDYEQREIWLMANDELFERENYEDKFYHYSNTLLNEMRLQVKYYENNITTCEIYYYDEQFHQDPYCDRNDAMLTANKWYINDKGLNITFGFEKENIYASILVCGIRNIETKEQITGAKNVLQYVTDKLGSDELDLFRKELKDIFSSSNNLYLDFCDHDKYDPKELIREKRKEIKPTPEDTKGFIDMPYRYIVDQDLNEKVNRAC